MNLRLVHKSQMFVSSQRNKYLYAIKFTKRNSQIIFLANVISEYLCLENYAQLIEKYNPRVIPYVLVLPFEARENFLFQKSSLESLSFSIAFFFLSIKFSLFCFFLCYVECKDDKKKKRNWNLIKERHKKISLLPRDEQY